MKKLTKNLINVSVASLGLIGIHFIGRLYASHMMDELAINPSPDTYANNFGVQYVAFMYVYGIIYLVLLVVGIFFLNKFLSKLVQ